MIDKLALKFAQELKARNNPSSYKELTIATVSKVEPLLLTVSNSQIQLSEEIGNLYIPECLQVFQVTPTMRKQ